MLLMLDFFYEILELYLKGLAADVSPYTENILC
jgi:hypothetical protein